MESEYTSILRDTEITEMNKMFSGIVDYTH